MRLSITRRSDLAVRALQALDGHPAGLAGPQLADAIGSTRGFVAQIMVPLVRRRWVASTAGRSGGYRLLPTGRAASVLDVIEVIEGPIAATHPLTGATLRTCVLGRDVPCSLASDPGREPCDFHDAWLAAERALIEGLRERQAVRPGSAASATDSPRLARRPGNALEPSAQGGLP